ncbi:hypothetical protein TRFO_26382 [Tritrichomonas foetus]|uniref:Secretory carrier-associated membrane protein n=1 Tax=Tritrichomonas foetus TaxID=1144522 RepID=A0A1J4K496_9EUKA|nr:hypothetical protein TRFO_26382 [Tritrichomonas foetus]|eukprot:OHT05786.1 hypothetical protein TRFO_26382 [Tritrichomonas foetus]
MKIILSSIFLIVFCPISFEISFFVLYKSLKNGKALRFFCFMLTYFIWFGILAFNLIGINNGGSVGFIQMINLFTGSTGVAVIALIFCILGCCDAAAMVWTFIQLIRYYKTNGIDKKAFKEGSTFAANYAKDHKEEIASYAADNREDIARIAADGYGDEI